ncbi:unnamed protein product [Rodentolepis nana]|uniref:Uncharacterized protein n=1 Tax=Rodentolepis nana TaxID=102285 RepID=A0A3P7VIG5_RODNA|nr:unnamed protein product [Rodentolepis nana]
MVEETSESQTVHGIKTSAYPPPPPLHSKSLVAQSNSTTTLAHNPVVVTPSIEDDGDDQWNDWTSDTEHENPSNKSLQPPVLSREEEELRERVAQVEALLAELEPKIASPSTFSLTRPALNLSDPASNPDSLTPTSANLQYKFENYSGDLGSKNKESGDEDDGWNVDD